MASGGRGIAVICGAGSGCDVSAGCGSGDGEASGDGETDTERRISIVAMFVQRGRIDCQQNYSAS
jgi:hypothetical protein